MLMWLFSERKDDAELYNELVSARFMYDVMMRNHGVESEKAKKYARRITELEKLLGQQVIAA